MMRVAISPAAAALYRALVERSQTPRDRVLMSNIRSVDWQSLTLSGERHEIHIRLVGDNAAAAGARLCDGLAAAEFSLAGLIVADICVVGVPRPAADGSVEIEIEALTIEE
ncbi:MAG: hypothetical protein QFB89_00250 [Pseudomonadota bacterium]|nr:hypothetical protein [Pseudomonadota bacterium]